MKKVFILFIVLIVFLNSPAQTKIIVAQDGSGKYLTVQEAFNSISINNAPPVSIYIKDGIYKEKLHLDSGKNFVTITGEDKIQNHYHL